MAKRTTTIIIIIKERPPPEEHRLEGEPGQSGHFKTPQDVRSVQNLTELMRTPPFPYSVLSVQSVRNRFQIEQSFPVIVEINSVISPMGFLRIVTWFHSIVSQKIGDGMGSD